MRLRQVAISVKNIIFTRCKAETSSYLLTNSGQQALWTTLPDLGDPLLQHLRRKASSWKPVYPGVHRNLLGAYQMNLRSVVRVCIIYCVKETWSRTFLTCSTLCMMVMLIAELNSRSWIFLGIMRDDETFQDKIWWSDEACFKLNGHINRHNCSYWSHDNPHVVLEKEVNIPGVVWAAMSSNGIIGPFLFDSSVTGQLYLDMLQTFFFPQVQHERDIRFQQDGAPTHYALCSWMAWRQFQWQVDWKAWTDRLATPYTRFIAGHFYGVFSRTWSTKRNRERSLIYVVLLLKISCWNHNLNSLFYFALNNKIDWITWNTVE